MWVWAGCALVSVCGVVDLCWGFCDRGLRVVRGDAACRNSVPCRVVSQSGRAFLLRGSNTPESGTTPATAVALQAVLKRCES